MEIPPSLASHTYFSTWAIGGACRKGGRGGKRCMLSVHTENAISVSSVSGSHDTRVICCHCHMSIV